MFDLYVGYCIKKTLDRKNAKIHTNSKNAHKTYALNLFYPIRRQKHIFRINKNLRDVASTEELTDWLN